MNYLLSLFILVPLLAFLVSLFFKNKQEKPLSLVVLFTTAVYVVAAIILSIFWGLNNFLPINENLITLYKTEGFAFVIQFYYDRITAVYSIIGALVFFLVATFSRYYMHRDEGFKRFFNTVVLFFINCFLPKPLFTSKKWIESFISLPV